MMAHYDYIIADLCLRTDVDLVAYGLRGFKPFAATEQDDHRVDCLVVVLDDMDDDSRAIISELSQSYVAEANADSRFFKTAEGYLYSIKPLDEDCEPTLFHIRLADHRVTTNIRLEGCNPAIFRFGIWIMFGVVLAEHRAIAIHSSVIESEGRGVLFLGESGTGKSTHTRLWRENIEGAKLLNDDSPIVRIVGDEVRVYGSPWSGKTPCYKALSYPVAGFCRLSQAPENRITRLKGIAAIGALLPSAPPQFAHDGYLQDAILTTIGCTLMSVPVYHLACLPNAEAAELSHKTIIGDATTIR